MALFSSNNPKEKQHSGVLGAFAVDVIKWEPESDLEASLIAHKHIYEDFPDGSYLIVGPSQMAVFTNNISAGDSLVADSAGQSQVSVFVGPCKIKLETGDSRFAPFRNISHSLTGGDSAYHSTVYFVNTTYMNDLPWGTQEPITVTDPEEEVNVHVRAFGMFGAHIEQIDTSVAALQARKFLQRVVGTRSDYSRNELLDFMRAKILEYVPQLLANNIVDEKISVLKISTKLTEFSQTIQQKLIPYFDEIGLTLDNFSFHSINVPDSDLKAINDLKIQKKQRQLEAEANAQQMDIESAARARMREREGYTYQQEQAYQVMQSAASNEGASANLMGTGMGLGMGLGVGGAFGAGMGQIVNNTIGQNQLSGQNTQNRQGTSGNTCPSCGCINPPTAKFCLNCGNPVMKATRCPNCGCELQPGAKFCMECGCRIAPSVCPSCGAKLTPGAKFCFECGEKL